jgi:tetratricopeptide (TPR) repeat protein
MYEAIARFQAAVTLDPNYAEALYNLGLAYAETKQPETAIAVWQEAIALQPDYVDAWWNLAALFAQQDQLAEAISCYQELLEYQLDSEEIYIQLGNLFAKAKDWRAAIECFEVAIELNSDNSNSDNLLENYLRLAWALHKSGDIEAAKLWYQRAIEFCPHSETPYRRFGNFLFEQGQIEAGLEQYHIGSQITPSSIDFWNDYSFVLLALGRLEHVIKYCETAIAIDPNVPTAYNNYGRALQAYGRLDEARQYYEKALKLSDGDIEIRFRLALLDLLEGNYERGLVEYEFRWQTLGSKPRLFEQPWWDGTDIANLTILVWAEQAYGDMIQFVRYLPFVVQKCRKVILQCPSPLTRLIGTLDDRIQILAGDAPFPDFDVHIPLMSLPRIFKTTVDTVPAPIPYLVKDVAELNKLEALQQKIQVRLPDFPQTALKIGIVWASGYFGDRPHQLELPLRKSCPASIFFQLLQLSETHPHLPDMHFYSLQYGRNAKDIADYADRPFLHDLTPFIQNFADTAVLISKLDLIISVDTSTVHLAGAMGKPVWVLLPLDADWRWLTEREDSPWYPTARLFRQKQPSDWEEILVRVKQALIELSQSIPF